MGFVGTETLPGVPGMRGELNVRAKEGGMARVPKLGKSPPPAQQKK